MPKDRDTYTYKLIRNGKIVHKGITNDLDRREREHQAQFPGASIHQEGRIKTREGALDWEAKQNKKYTTTPQGS